MLVFSRITCGITVHVISPTSTSSPPYMLIFFFTLTPTSHILSHTSLLTTWHTSKLLFRFNKTHLRPDLIPLFRAEERICYLIMCAYKLNTKVQEGCNISILLVCLLFNKIVINQYLTGTIPYSPPSNKPWPHQGHTVQPVTASFGGGGRGQGVGILIHKQVSLCMPPPPRTKSGGGVSLTVALMIRLINTSRLLH